MKMSSALFARFLVAQGLPKPELEYRFHPVRKWRFDYAFPKHMVAIEVDGGIWLKGGGRHTRGAGWLKDAEKLNHAAAMGWRMLRCTPDQLATQGMLEMIKQALSVSEAA